MIQLLLPLLLVANTAFAAQTYEEHLIHSSLVRNSSKLGKIDVVLKGDKFSIIKDGKQIAVNNYDVSPRLRTAAKYNAIKAYLEGGYLTVNEGIDNGTPFYSINGAQTGKGGGPLLSAILYGACKGIMYGGVAAGVTATVVGAGAAVVVSGGALAALPGGIAAGAASSAITAAGGAAAAGQITIAAAAAAPLVASIEAASMACAALGMAIPTI